MLVLRQVCFAVKRFSVYADALSCINISFIVCISLFETCEEGMTDKKLKKLSRSELLELLIDQMEKNELLEKELEEAKNKLESKKIICENAGSVAEASLQLNDVFTSAQNAAQQYLENIKRMSDEAEEEKNRIIEEAKRKADEIMRSSEDLSNKRKDQDSENN